MDAGAPWMEALVQGDLPIVELTNSDLFGLDKEDDHLGTQDFGVIEPLVQIASPEQQLENVDNLSENSFCMLEPEVRLDPPEVHMDDSDSKTPEDADDDTEGNNEPEICTNELGVDYDEPEGIGQNELSSDTGDRSPTPDFLEPLVQIKTPDVEIVPQEITLDSPEVLTIEDTPEKFNDGESMKSPYKNPVHQPIFDSNSDHNLKELRIKLIKIDETLTIVNNTVRLPGHMCDSDVDSTSNSNGLRSSRPRRERTATNQRSPYSLRIKAEVAEVADDEDASYSSAVRFNPYALSAQKTTAGKRNPAATKGKLAKNRQTPQTQPDDSDDFLPTDFLEASMSEGMTPSGSGSLLQKTLTLVGKKPPLKIEHNGTAVSAVPKAKGPPERLASFRSGFVVQNVGGTNSLETLAKVMANSSLSLTHRPKPGTAGRKPPGQTGMVNHDHQYSSRLSNENVTRLETQIKTLQSDNRTLKLETDTLRKQLAAANAYIATSLTSAVKVPPIRPAQPRAQTYRAQPQPRAQTQLLRAHAQQFRMQARPVLAPRAHAVRSQSLRVQAILPRGSPPARTTLVHKKANPGVMIVPARPAAMVRAMRASTQALTVIPIRKGPRPPELDAAMPSFEQVNVNEHFGMHFLTE